MSNRSAIILPALALLLTPAVLSAQARRDASSPIPGFRRTRVCRT